MTIEQFIAMYMPAIVTVAGYFTTFVTLLKHLKDNARTISNRNGELEKNIKQVIQQNNELRELNIQLMEQLTRVRNDELHKEMQE